MKKITAALAAVTLAGGMAALSAAPAQAAPLSTWDFSQTRATGHYALVDDGLHIWTEGATSTDKVAGYLPVQLPLADVSSASLQYTAEFGMTPGSQLVVDVTGDGKGDGILVGEAVYGENFWLSNSATDGFKALAPNVGGGNGSQWFGTLTEWGIAAPDATIVAVGFSLGSGVHGDGIVHSVTVGSNVFDFDVEPVNPLPAGVHRLAGADRYATAVEISKRFNPGVPVVYVVTGANYPDALSASAVAGAQDSPLLLVPGTSIPTVVWNELGRLQPQKIIVVGGYPVVSQAVSSQLEQIAPVERIAGADRYGTSRQIAERSPVKGGTNFIATGRNFPDALSASAAAGSLGGAVVLLDGTKTTVDNSTSASLQTHLNTDTVRIAGGTGVVSSGIETSLKGSHTVYRHAGADRYSTGVAINAATFTNPDTVYLAIGTGYADALAGGALAAATGSPLFLVQENCVPTSVRTQIQAYNPSTIVLLGGTGVIGDAVGSLTECAPTD